MFFGFGTPKIGGVLMKTFSKPSFTHLLKKKAPGGGGGLPDFTRCGTNYLHTPLLKKYPESNSLHSNGMFFGFSAPKIGGVLMKTFSKPSVTHFLHPTTDHSCPKNAVLGKKKLLFLGKKMRVVGDGGSQTLDHLPKNPGKHAFSSPAPWK